MATLNDRILSSGHDRINELFQEFERLIKNDRQENILDEIGITPIVKGRPPMRGNT